MAHVCLLCTALNACSASLVCARTPCETSLKLSLGGFKILQALQKGYLSFQKARPHLIHKETLLVEFLECLHCVNLIFSDPQD